MKKNELLKHRKLLAVELEKNPLYDIVANGRKWICPFCAQVGASRWPELPEARLSAALKHLSSGCDAWLEGSGRVRQAAELRRARLLNELRSRIKKSLVGQKEWQFRDLDSLWYCPFCVKATQVSIPRDRRMNEELLGKIVEHVSGCYVFKRGDRTEKPFSYIQEVVTRANTQKRLRSDLRRDLENEDPIWLQRDRVGAWICPYCHQALNHIDISSPMVRRENAPKLIVDHLTGVCDPYSAGVEASRAKASRTQQVQSAASFVESDDEIPVLDASAVVRTWGRDGEAASREAGLTLRGLESSGEIELISDEDLPESLRRKTNTTPKGDPFNSWRAEISQELEQAKSRANVTRTSRLSAAPARHFQGLAPLAEVYGVELSALYRQGTPGSGDFIDQIPIGPLSVFALGSVVTRDEDPRTLAGRLQGLLRIHARDTTDPAEMLRLLNRDMVSALGPRSFAGLFVAVLDPRPGRLSFARSGLFAPLLLRPSDGFRRRLEDFEGTAIGHDRSAELTETVGTTHLDLQPHDLFVIHSAGVLEAKNRRREPFGIERFENLVDRYGKHEAAYLTDKLEERLLEYSDQEPRHDFATLALRRRSGARER